MRVLSVVVLLGSFGWGIACTFTPIGGGAGASLDETDDGAQTTTSSGDTPSPFPGTDGGSTLLPEPGSSTVPSDSTGATSGDESPDDTSTTSATSTTGADSESSSSGREPCTGAGEELIVWAADAEVTLPMALVASLNLPGNPQYAFSLVQDAGVATFSFETACDAEFRIWGLVWDDTPGADNGADSFYAMVDGEPPSELSWYYGCQTGGNAGPAWSYQRIMNWIEFDCIYQDLTFPLTAGAHEVTLRNREGGLGTNFAGVAAIVISSDPATDPNTLFDPSP